MSGKFQLDLSKKFPALPHAPIIEAVLHWQAAASLKLDQAALQRKLTDSFPKYESAPQHNIETALSGSPQGMELKQSTNWDGFRLTRKENDQPAFICQFKRSGLVVSRLAPYKDWEEFESEALRFWDAFVEIGQPTEIARLSTRYISQIAVNSISEVQDYIDIGEEPLAAIGVSADGFFYQNTLNLADLPYKINLVRTVQPLKQSSAPLSLIVDIDVGTTDNIAIADFAAVPQRLKELRFIKNKVFFTLMKDAETKFGEKKS